MTHTLTPTSLQKNHAVTVLVAKSKLPYAAEMELLVVAVLDLRRPVVEQSVARNGQATHAMHHVAQNQVVVATLLVAG